MAMIVVDPKALAKVAGALGDAGERLSGISRSLANATREETGSSGLASALEEFHGQWRREFHKLGEATGLAGDQLGEALRGYGAVEAAISQSAG